MEIIMALSDLSGLLAAILLAIPAKHTQSIRDNRDALAEATAASDEVTRAVERATEALEGTILKLSKRDIQLATWGIYLLGAAFLLKLAGEVLLFFFSGTNEQ